MLLVLQDRAGKLIKADLVDMVLVWEKDQTEALRPESTVNYAWVGAQNLKKSADSRHQRQNLQKSLQLTAIM